MCIQARCADQLLGRCRCRDVAYYAGLAPRAVILGDRDAILCLGEVVAEEMGWPMIPIVEAPVDALRAGQNVSLNKGGEIVIVSQG